jgi:hypothetical protein
MSSKCYGCGNEFPGRMREVRFEYQGIAVKDHVPGLKCDECFIKNFSRNFETYAGEVLKIENGELTVNWEQLLAVKKKRTHWDMILQLLEGFEILSIFWKGNWRIDVGHGSANPRMISTGTPMFFTRKRDAMDYAGIECSGRGGYEILGG